MQTADSLLRLVDHNPRSYCVPSLGEKIDAERASQLQRERQKWLYECRAMIETRWSNSGQFPSWGAVQVVVVLLLSCAAAFGSCVQVIGSLASDETRGLQSPLHVGYIFFPISTSAAGVVAVQLHGSWRRHAHGFDSILCSAVMSTFHVLYFVLPVFVVVRWTTSSMQDIEFLDAYQVGLLVFTVLLPVYAVQTGGDDW